MCDFAFIPKFSMTSRPIIVLCFCFVCLRHVYPMLPVSLDCQFLIAPLVFSNGFSRPIILSEMDELSNIFSQITCLMESIHGKNILCMKHYKLLCFCGSEIQDSRNNRANILHNILRENEKYSLDFRKNHRRLSRTDHAPILSTDHSRVNSNKMIVLINYSFPIILAKFHLIIDD